MWAKRMQLRRASARFTRRTASDSGSVRPGALQLPPRVPPLRLLGRRRPHRGEAADDGTRGIGKRRCHRSLGRSGYLEVSR